MVDSLGGEQLTFKSGNPSEAVAASGCILSMKTLIAHVKAAHDSPLCSPPAQTWMPAVRLIMLMV